MKPYLFLAFLLGALAWVSLPAVTKAKRSAYKLKAVSCAKNIGVAFNEFDSRYDQYPGPIIPESLRSVYPQQDRQDSNYILGQIIIAQSTDSEKIFDSGRSLGRNTQADDTISPLTELLRPGECEFSYITLDGKRPLSSSYTRSSTPLLVSHIDPNTGKFDLTSVAGQYVYLRGDRSVATGKISPDGIPLLKGQGRRGLFDTGPDSVWDNDTPQIHLPLPYQVSSDAFPRIKIALITASALVLVFLIFQKRHYLKRKATPDDTL
jgi:hypothetical protein